MADVLYRGGAITPLKIRDKCSFKGVLPPLTGVGGAFMGSIAPLKIELKGANPPHRIILVLMHVVIGAAA